jgi:hypothetical protein
VAVAQAEAALETTRTQAARATALFEAKAISQQEADLRRNGLASAEAAVQLLRRLWPLPRLIWITPKCAVPSWDALAALSQA